jgi:hypothetical protein
MEMRRATPQAATLLQKMTWDHAVARPNLYLVLRKQTQFATNFVSKRVGMNVHICTCALRPDSVLQALMFRILIQETDKNHVGTDMWQV